MQRTYPQPRRVGFDASNVLALERSQAAVAELAAIPDTPELRASDEAALRCDHYKDEPTKEDFLRHMQLMAERLRGRELDFTQATPAELFALCLAQAPDAA